MNWLELTSLIPLLLVASIADLLGDLCGFCFSGLFSLC
jgi:hypothetical protein